MTDSAIVTKADPGAIIESVVVGGDLSKLNPEQRVSYYRQVCTSLGLNPLTRPFDYITLNGKLTLYARKDASEQLRRINKISIDKPDITFQDEWIIVSVVAYTPDGRRDSDIGVVNKKDMRGDFGNAVMKAVTKAKRRVTLSICGLGMLDETEVETIPDAQPVVIHDALEAVTAQAEQVVPLVSLDTARDMTTSKGEKYGEMDNVTLAAVINSINKALKAADLTPARREELQFKRDCATVVLQANNAN